MTMFPNPKLGLRKPTKERAANRERQLRDKRIEQLYYDYCSGVEINIMDIGKVFKFGHDAIDRNPLINDLALAQAIIGFVQTIRKN